MMDRINLLAGMLTNIAARVDETTFIELWVDNGKIDDPLHCRMLGNWISQNSESVLAVYKNWLIGETGYVRVSDDNKHLIIDTPSGTIKLSDKAVYCIAVDAIYLPTLRELYMGEKWVRSLDGQQGTLDFSLPVVQH